MRGDHVLICDNRLVLLILNGIWPAVGYALWPISNSTTLRTTQQLTLDDCHPVHGLFRARIWPDVDSYVAAPHCLVEAWPEVELGEARAAETTSLNVPEFGRQSSFWSL